MSLPTMTLPAAPDEPSMAHVCVQCLPIRGTCLMVRGVRRSLPLAMRSFLDQFRHKNTVMTSPHRWIGLNVPTPEVYARKKGPAERKNHISMLAEMSTSGAPHKGLAPSPYSSRLFPFAHGSFETDSREKSYILSEDQPQWRTETDDIGNPPTLSEHPKFSGQKWFRQAQTGQS